MKTGDNQTGTEQGSYIVTRDDATLIKLFRELLGKPKVTSRQRGLIEKKPAEVELVGAFLSKEEDLSDYATIVIMAWSEGEVTLRKVLSAIFTVLLKDEQSRITFLQTLITFRCCDHAAFSILLWVWDIVGSDTREISALASLAWHAQGLTLPDFAEQVMDKGPDWKPQGLISRRISEWAKLPGHDSKVQAFAKELQGLGVNGIGKDTCLDFLLREISLRKVMNEPNLVQELANS